jgi:hypothetical protein
VLKSRKMGSVDVLFLAKDTVVRKTWRGSSGMVLLRSSFFRTLSACGIDTFVLVFLHC